MIALANITPISPSSRASHQQAMSATWAIKHDRGEPVAHPAGVAAERDHQAGHAQQHGEASRWACVDCVSAGSDMAPVFGSTFAYCLNLLERVERVLGGVRVVAAG